MRIISRTVFIGTMILILANRSLFANGEWVNQQGCYCGGYVSADIPITYISKGDGTAAEREATRQQMEYWNKYASIYRSTIGDGLGQPNNGLNEVNTFISNEDADKIYGVKMQPDLCGLAIFQPRENFGNFNECKDFNATGCGDFKETDILINKDFFLGWTTDPKDYSKAFLPATALHEIGHTWGAHHVFTLPAFGDSYSSMNYMRDDSGKFITRMDATTIRAAYAEVARNVTDIGIFPFIYGNSQYGETYASIMPTVTNAGETLRISNFLIQNIGTEEANDVALTFYFSLDNNIEPTDIMIGTVRLDKPVSANSEGDFEIDVPLPQDLKREKYYVGAIATIGGREDSIGVNNRFIIGRPAPTPVLVDSIIDDPGFEKGKNSPQWHQKSKVWDSIIFTDPKKNYSHSGSFWGWFCGHPTKNELGSIEQVVEIPDETSNTYLEFYLKISRSGTNAVMNVQMDDKVLFQVTQDDLEFYKGYQLVEINISEFADGQSHTLRFESTIDSGEKPSSFLVDDLYLGPQLSEKDKDQNFIGGGMGGGGCFIKSLLASILY